MDVKSIDKRILAGIQVPATPIVDRAIEYARQNCEPYLFNHVVRSWLFAARIGQLKNIEHDAEVVAVGTLLHDITLNKDFVGPRRFEVEGADLARSFATDIGFDKLRAQLIWDSVALNSTPSIGLYKEAEVALCTAGVMGPRSPDRADALVWGLSELFPSLVPRDHNNTSAASRHYQEAQNMAYDPFNPGSSDGYDPYQRDSEYSPFS